MGKLFSQDDQTASEVSSNSVGNVSSTDVQGAISDLDQLVSSNNKFKSGEFSMPNSTGNFTIDTVGFEPNYIKLFPRFPDSVADVNWLNNASGTMLWFMGVFTRDPNGTTDQRVYWNAHEGDKFFATEFGTASGEILRIPSDVADSNDSVTFGFVASVASTNSNGFVLNFTQVINDDNDDEISYVAMA